MSKATPMLQQYMDVKKEYEGCILFFRLGDFYEMFLDDAVTASRELEIVLTSRESGGAERIPMCGIPYHAVSGYLAKLLSKGYKVAICEQMEDPKLAKGIVKREVIRVITPGTVIEDQLLNEKANNYLASFVSRENFWGLAYVDLSTGEFKTTQFLKTGTPLLFTELTRIRPAELYILKNEQDIISKSNQLADTVITLGNPLSFQYDQAYRLLIDHFQVQSLRAFGCEELPAAICAAGAVLGYLVETQKNTLLHLRKIQTYETGEYMALDLATRRNLELIKNVRSGETSSSLYGVLDQTVTSMGGRMLRTWVEQPLTRIKPIEARQAAIGELSVNLETREIIREGLHKTYDLQRILSKLASNSANARDLLALKNTLTEIPALKDSLQNFCAERLILLREKLQPLSSLKEMLDSALKEDPPLSIKEGGMIKNSFHSELAHLIESSTQGRRWVAELEQKEKERTGIKSLKVGYNQVFGYYIEVTNSNLNLVPPDYVRKQTLANGERFINQALKEYEDLIVNAHEKSTALEFQIFCELREAVLKEIDSLQANADALAELDVLVALAETAVRYNYVRPEMNENGKILIADGRHPVVERMLPAGKFVPNDTFLEMNENRTQIITGPNMAGKSTYMRQVALIVLLAHIGSFIPAKSGEISVVDRIFTRVGASDDLATGQSTFMVEMNEVAYILNHATSKSLVILDEIGRGTSTFDGLSIAWAVVEFIHHTQRIGCKTLVATHYHELTELEQKNPGLKNYHIAVEHDGEEIVFLRKILPGKADQSYGIEVARLAGLPNEITGRAKEILATLEKNEIVESKKTKAPKASENQLALFPVEKDLILEEIRGIDLVSITPLQALNYLYEWQQKIRRQMDASCR
ncbi:MAG TPA: DNA mismatch repair protein MutS [Firmicutes bacterium]|jgi:DNA mismatch repair protein MutS|nr:DNA mismatch repair protein MutS [Bacillota bacterium]